MEIKKTDEEVRRPGLGFIGPLLPARIAFNYILKRMETKNVVMPVFRAQALLV